MARTQVSFTDDEARALLVAIRIASAVQTEIMSMSPDKEIRLLHMDAIRRLESARRKLACVSSERYE